MTSQMQITSQTSTYCDSPKHDLWEKAQTTRKVPSLTSQVQGGITREHITLCALCRGVAMSNLHCADATETATKVTGRYLHHKQSRNQCTLGVIHMKLTVTPCLLTGYRHATCCAQNTRGCARLGSNKGTVVEGQHTHAAFSQPCH